MSWRALPLSLLVTACHGARTDASSSAPTTSATAPAAAASIAPETIASAAAPTSAECEAALTPGPGPQSWVKTCDADGRHLVTCWAGRRVVVATCSRCVLSSDRPRCEAPEVDLGPLLERELPAGLARCAGRLRYTARLVVQDESRSWTIDTTLNPPTVRAETGADRAKVDSTLTISRAHLLDLIAGSEWDAMRSFFAGRLRIEGDQGAGMNAAAWLSRPVPKSSCSKAD